MNKINNNLFLPLMLFALATSNFGCNDKKEDNKQTTEQTKPVVPPPPPPPPAGGSGGTTTQTPPVAPPGQPNADTNEQAESKDQAVRVVTGDQTAPAAKKSFSSRAIGTIRKHPVRAALAGFGLIALGKYVYSLFNPSEQTKIDKAYGKQAKMEQQVNFVEDFISELRKQSLEQDKIKPIEEFYGRSWSKEKEANLLALKKSVEENLKKFEITKKAHDQAQKNKSKDSPESLEKLKADLESAKKTLHASVQKYAKESNSMYLEWSKAFDNFYKELCNSSIKENLKNYLTTKYKELHSKFEGNRGTLKDLSSVSQEELEKYDIAEAEKHKMNLEYTKLYILKHAVYKELLNTYYKHIGTTKKDLLNQSEAVGTNTKIVETKEVPAKKLDTIDPRNTSLISDSQKKVNQFKRKGQKIRKRVTFKLSKSVDSQDQEGHSNNIGKSDTQAPSEAATQPVVDENLANDQEIIVNKEDSSSESAVKQNTEKKIQETPLTKPMKVKKDDYEYQLNQYHENHTKLQIKVMIIEEFTKKLSEQQNLSSKQTTVIRTCEKFYNAWIKKFKHKEDNILKLKKDLESSFQEANISITIYNTYTDSVIPLSALKDKAEEATKKLEDSTEKYKKEADAFFIESSKVFTSFYKRICKSAIQKELKEYLEENSKALSVDIQKNSDTTKNLLDAKRRYYLKKFDPEFLEKLENDILKDAAYKDLLVKYNYYTLPWSEYMKQRIPNLLDFLINYYDTHSIF